MIDLPEALQAALIEALKRIGDPNPILSATALSGGCINQARHLRTIQNEYFLKWNPANPPGTFQAEAHGLELLRATHTVRVPAVISIGEPAENEFQPFLLLEWLSPRPGCSTQFSQSSLGSTLARLHLTSQQCYGLDRDNFIGPTPQSNPMEANWVTFFRDHRLLPQFYHAEKYSRLSSYRRHGLERLFARLENWLSGVPRRPALLHGDLWAGNIIPGLQSEPVLIDPAAYYGDREAEIAYTELFGGFDSHFYQAYQSIWPLEPGYSERRDLYNLYHLLNHLNLFGESYGLQIDSILHHFIG